MTEKEKTKRERDLEMARRRYAKNYANAQAGVEEFRARAGLPERKVGERKCLRCQSPFLSEDVTQFRVCPRCKHNPTARTNFADVGEALYNVFPDNARDMGILDLSTETILDPEARKKALDTKRKLREGAIARRKNSLARTERDRLSREKRRTRGQRADKDTIKSVAHKKRAS